MTNEQLQEPGDLPKPPKHLPPGEEPNPERKEPQPSRQPGRPTPSGVPNEIQAARGGYRYKGGRQESGGIPNPDDSDDEDSAGSFRGTADDLDDRDETHGEATALNGRLRNPL